MVVVVRYGHGDNWSASVQVDVSIECSNAIFGDPLYLQAKECQCKQGATLTTTTMTTTTTTTTTTATTTTTTTTITTTTTTTITAAQDPDWERCACEHIGHPTHSDCEQSNICQCNGVVRYGHGDKWSDSVQVDGSIECSNEEFGDPFYLQAKECQCQQATPTTTTTSTTTTTTTTSTTTTSETTTTTTTATWDRCA